MRRQNQLGVNTRNLQSAETRMVRVNSTTVRLTTMILASEVRKNSFRLKDTETDQACHRGTKEQLPAEYQN